MHEGILTRSWSAEDLAKIGKDNHLTTLFMNQVNFEKQTIKLYPYQLRKFYAARYTGGEARFYATDQESAEWFFRQRWGLKPESLIEISGAVFAATKPLTTTPIRVPKATLEAPVFDCPRCCVDKEGIGVVLNSMDAAIIDTEGKLKLQSQNPVFARSIQGRQAGARELGVFRAVRDSLAELPFCKEKKVKEMVKPPPKKAQASKQAAVKEATKKPIQPAKPAKVEKEEAYARPFADTPVVDLVEKWSKAKRNSTLALKDLEAISQKYDITDCKEALLEYRDIDRSDYSDSEEHQEARDEAWETFVECLDSLAEEEETEMEEKEEAYARPFARVTNVKGELLRYEDALGKLLPKKLWTATV